MPTATKNDIIDLSSENKTEELAKKISKKLKPGNIVFLNGEMGVGKTTFVRYLVNELQKKNQSPYLLLHHHMPNFQVFVKTELH